MATATRSKRTATPKKPPGKGKAHRAPERRALPTPPVKGGKAQAPATRADAPPKDAKAGKKKFQRREELRRDLVRELGQARENLAACSAAVASRLDAVFAQLLGAFEGGGIPGEPARLPAPRVQAAMVLALRGLKVKPKKGRLKDLGRLADLAASLARLMPQGG